jgi:hypothetical protein
MSDTEFGEFLDQCRGELRTKQELLMKFAGGKPYNFDLHSAVLTIGDEKFSITVAGSFCPSRSTWLWGWANDTFPESVRNQSSNIRTLYATTGFQVFLDHGIRATKRDAEDLTAMAVHALESSGFWRLVSDDFELYLCLGNRL